MTIRIVIKRGENLFSFRCSIATALAVTAVHIVSKFIS